MFSVASSSSSPFSSRSTDPSSPEAATLNDAYGQVQKQNGGNNGHVDYPASAGVQPILNALQTNPYAAFPNRSMKASPPTGDISRFSQPPTTASSQASTSKGVNSAAASVNGGASQGATRSEPPKRQIEVDGLPIANVPLDELAAHPERNRVLLQGDPQIITKQRVETAIRVIIDFLRAVPSSPSNPLAPPSLQPYLPLGPTGSLIAFERIGTFRAIRLQAGTTTKASSKKQLQAGPTPREQLAYLETEVYMSGEDGKRVYACKRCRMREARRREHKDAARKKQSNSGSDTSSSNQRPPKSRLPPSQDYITGENAEQYDPHRGTQVVEEPDWDPYQPDWRHEIVLFNSAPEVPIKDGSCVWLPFRVVCYGKCHGEKVGFKIKFTIRSFDGRIIATSTTQPIRITDDHKTDVKTKGRIEGMTSATQPTVPRGRKGRQSAASSRRQSPAPSEGGESVVSEVGAVFTKQAPSVRGGKPYDRPISQPPLAASTQNQLDMLAQQFAPPGTTDMPSFQRHTSSGSIHSVASMSALPVQNNDLSGTNWSRANSTDYGGFELNQPPVAGTVSPNALRRPNFSFTALDGFNQYSASAPHSTSSSNVASPVSALRPLGDDMLYSNPNALNIMNAFSGLEGVNMQSQQSLTNPMLFDNSADVDMANALNTGFEGLFDRSSAASISSSFEDTSAFSTGFGDRSSGMFSDSGVVPDTMEGFLDFSGVTDQSLSQPFPLNSLSPPMGNNFSPLALGGPASPVHSTGISPHQLQPTTTNQNQNQQQNMYNSMPVPTQPQASILHVIPAEGPVAGGIDIAIAGTGFTPGAVVMFGSRVAKTSFVAEGFVKCVLPPGVASGQVEVAVQGSFRLPGVTTQTFTYTGMDKEMMRLALQVRDHYQGSANDAAYRLAQHVAGQSNNNSDWSDRSSMSPQGFSPLDKSWSPTRQASNEIVEEPGNDLQTTVINFLASIDRNAPGSLRRSGAINHRNAAAQTMLHLATVMGFHRLARRLIVIGAHLDLQDINGFTPLAFASLCGQANCARVLIEAGASYDRPTAYGELPLDLAKLGEHQEVEVLLLSAVWSTQPTVPSADAEDTTSASIGSGSEIDDDNPSSGSEDEVSRALRHPRKVRKSRGKQRVPNPPIAISPPRSSSVVSQDLSQELTPVATPSLAATPQDDPPPYDDDQPRPTEPSWMSRTLSNLSNSSIPHPKIPDSVLHRLPIPSFWSEGPSTTTHNDDTKTPPQGWVAFPAPSWETLQKMASPEEVRLFTQAMAAAALNAVVQSTSSCAMVDPSTTSREVLRGRDSRRRSRSSRRGSRSDAGSSPGRGVVVKHVKQDRMLYLFWLPILLFVGFWLLVTALPIATGFSLIYARQITKAIKQRM